MASLGKNVVEPAFIVAAFTVGCLINRRRTNHGRFYDIESNEPYSDTSPPLKPTIIHSERPFNPRAPTTFFSLVSRFFNAFPFLIEIWYWNLTYWIYQLARAISARIIAGDDAVFHRAKGHALTVLNIERLFGIDIEQQFQSSLMPHRDWLMPILAKVYYSHISVGIMFLIYTYTVLPPATYQRIRRTIVMDNAIAFVIVTLWRCYPPRLLPREFGFVDILHSDIGSGSAWTNNRFQLTIAAMPSLHFGTALFFAVCLCRFSPHCIVQILAPLWPMAMLFTIVGTANHFLMDAIVGAMVPFLGWRYNYLILKLLPIQEYVFAPLTRRLDLEDDMSLEAPKTS